MFRNEADYISKYRRVARPFRRREVDERLALAAPTERAATAHKAKPPSWGCQLGGSVESLCEGGDLNPHESNLASTSS